MAKLLCLITLAAALASCNMLRMPTMGPKDEQSSFRQVTALHDSGKYAKALVALDAFAAEYPATPMESAAIYYRASCLVGTGDEAQALELFIKLATGRAGPWKGNAAIRLHQLDEKK